MKKKNSIMNMVENLNLKTMKMFQPSLFYNIANIKSRLQQMGVSAQDIANVNWNDSNAVNEFAKQVMTGFMQKDPNIANQIKQTAKNVGANEVVDIIDKM